VYVPPVLTFKNFESSRTQCLYTRIRRAVVAASTAERRCAYMVLVGKPEGRPRSRWENNVRIDLKGK
jgi:hypothetical protein